MPSLGGLRADLGVSVGFWAGLDDELSLLVEEEAGFLPAFVGVLGSCCVERVAPAAGEGMLVAVMSDGLRALVVLLVVF